MNFVRWKFTYRRLLPVVSWMIIHQEFHPGHSVATVNWWGRCKVPGPGWELMNYERMV